MAEGRGFCLLSLESDRLHILLRDEMSYQPTLYWTRPTPMSNEPRDSDSFQPNATAAPDHAATVPTSPATPIPVGSLQGSRRTAPPHQMSKVPARGEAWSSPPAPGATTRGVRGRGTGPPSSPPCPRPRRGGRRRRVRPGHLSSTFLQSIAMSRDSSPAHRVPTTFVRKYTARDSAGRVVELDAEQARPTSPRHRP